MFNNEDDFKNLIDRLKIDDKSTASHKQPLRAQMLNLFNATRQKDSQTKPPTQAFWRIITKSSITKLAVAAVVMLAVLFGVHYFGASIDGTSIVWVDVVRSFNTVKTVYIKISLNLADGSTPVVECWINMPNESYIKSSHTKLGDKILIDDGTNRLTLDETQRTALLERSSLSPELLTKKLSFLGIDAFRDGQSSSFKFATSGQQNGQKLIVYDLKFRDGLCGTAYVEANAMLPLKIVSTDSKGVTRSEVIFDYRPIAGNIFSTAIPAGFTEVSQPNLHQTATDANASQLEDSSNTK